MNVDLREECNTRVKDLWVCEVHLRCVSLQVCFDVCVMYTEPCQGDPLHSDGGGEECGVQQGCCYGIIEDVSLVSLIIQQVCCWLSLAHKIHTSYRSLSSHTNTFTPVPFSFPASERLHSLAYRLKPALTVPARLTHTLSRGHTTLWNNYSFNWQLINLKSIWPCKPNLEIEGLW